MLNTKCKKVLQHFLKWYCEEKLTNENMTWGILQLRSIFQLHFRISKALFEEIFAVSQKIGTIRGIIFPRKIVFWTIHEKKIDIRKNKFLLLTYFNWWLIIYKLREDDFLYQNFVLNFIFHFILNECVLFPKNNSPL